MYHYHKQEQTNFSHYKPTKCAMSKTKLRPVDEQSLFEISDIDIIAIGESEPTSLTVLFSHLSLHLQTGNKRKIRFIPSTQIPSYTLEDDDTHLTDKGSSAWYTFLTDATVVDTVVYFELQVFKVYLGFIMIGIANKDYYAPTSCLSSRLYFNDHRIIDNCKVGVLFDGQKKNALWYLDGKKQGPVHFDDWNGNVVVCLACGQNDVKINNDAETPKEAYK
jgi:hypothetical protein